MYNKLFKIFLSLCLLVYAGTMQAQPQPSAADSPDIIAYSLDRLEKLVDEISPAYKKAKKGKIADKKKLVELVGEVQAIRSVLNVIEDNLSAGQLKKLVKLFDKLPEGIKKDQEILLSDLEVIMVDENLLLLDELTDQMIGLTLEILSGNSSAKEAVMHIAIDVAKHWTINEFFRLTEDQTIQKNKITEKVNEVYYNNKHVDLKEIYHWLASNNFPNFEEEEEYIDTNENDDNMDNSVGDKLIDDYELITKEFIPLIHKIREGDGNAADEYELLAKKAIDIGENLSKITLTPKQTTRLQRIAEKFAKEINQIYNNSETDTSENQNDEMGDSEIVDEYDTLIDLYEETVDSYILIYKKHMAGDTEAITELQTLAEKLNSIAQSFADCTFSDEDTNRLQQIAEKVAKAVSEENK